VRRLEDVSTCQLALVGAHLLSSRSILERTALGVAEAFAVARLKE
jgi:hypothetical protein